MKDPTKCEAINKSIWIIIFLSGNNSKKSYSRIKKYVNLGKVLYPESYDTCITSFDDQDSGFSLPQIPADRQKLLKFLSNKINGKWFCQRCKTHNNILIVVTVLPFFLSGLKGWRTRRRDPRIEWNAKVRCVVMRKPFERNRI